VWQTPSGGTWINHQEAPSGRHRQADLPEPRSTPPEAMARIRSNASANVGTYSGSCETLAQTAPLAEYLIAPKSEVTGLIWMCNGIVDLIAIDQTSQICV